MNLFNPILFRVISFPVPCIFPWTFGGLFDISYAVTFSDQQSAFIRQHAKIGKRPEERFRKTLNNLEVILHNPVINTCTKNSKLLYKLIEIYEFNFALRENFKFHFRGHGFLLQYVV